jgi:UDP-glucuronate 4-epimerase
VTKRVLITGAAGFIGGHVSRAFLAAGWGVTGLDNFDPFYDRAIKEEGIADLRDMEAFQLREGDIRDAGAVREALEGVDLVLHLAARAGVRPSIEDPEGYASVNIAGTATLLEGSRAAGITRMVFGSSSSVYGDDTPVPFREDAPATEPISPYAATKRAGELQCRVYSHLFGFRIAALRFFTVYGARQRPDLAIHKFTRAICRGETIRQFGDGSSERDYTYIDDIVQGVLAAADWAMRDGAAFDIFNLGESRTVTLRSLIELIATTVEREPIVEVHPPAAGDVRRTCADVGKAKEVLGYDPGVTIQDGIRKFVDWYKATHESPS